MPLAPYSGAKRDRAPSVHEVVDQVGKWFRIEDPSGDIEVYLREGYQQRAPPSTIMPRSVNTISHTEL